MKNLHGVVCFVGAACAALVGAWVNDAAACGGCFAPPSENTVVSGHRMVLSIASTQTTLYDQITYAGNPSSFAWVLPIHGQVTVGLSADLMFEQLDGDTTHTVTPPPRPTPSVANSANQTAGPFANSSFGNDGVTVLAQATVGPYETVQLASSDPGALEKWLSDHGYSIPDEMQPVIAGYVQEGMDFLALKLVPGTYISAMRPVRVTMPGAAPTLPLRMVLGGAGATVPITLWVVAEAAYEPETPFSSFKIKTEDLVWDFRTSSSNYRFLADAGYQSSQGFGWLDEVSIPFSVQAFESQIKTAIVQGGNGGEYDPAPDSDAAAPDPLSQAGAALTAAADDLQALFGGMDPTNIRVTRLHGELPRATLSTDLTLGAAVDQSEVPLSQQAPRALDDITGGTCPGTGCPGAPAAAYQPPGTGGTGTGQSTDPEFARTDAGAPAAMSQGDPAPTSVHASGSKGCAVARGFGGRSSEAPTPAFPAALALLAFALRARRIPD